MCYWVTPMANYYLDGVDDSDWTLDVDGFGEVDLVLGRGFAEVLAHDANAAVPDIVMKVLH